MAGSLAGNVLQSGNKFFLFFFNFVSGKRESFSSGTRFMSLFDLNCGDNYAPLTHPQKCALNCHSKKKKFRNPFSVFSTKKLFLDAAGKSSLLNTIFFGGPLRFGGT
jgi:hypothetical protein